MKRKIINSTIVIIIDLFTLLLSFILIDLFKPLDLVSYIPDYFRPFGLLLIIRILILLNNQKKIQFAKDNELGWLVIKVNFVSISVFAIIAYAFSAFTSRIVIFGTVGLSFVVELIYVFILNIIYKIQVYDEDYLQDNISRDITKKVPEEEDYHFADIFENDSTKVLHEIIAEETGESAYRFIRSKVNIASPETIIVSTITRFNILNQTAEHYKAIVNLKITNDIRYINKFFETVNDKLHNGGAFIGCSETNIQRRNRIYRQYPYGLKHLIFFADFIFQRVCPKLPGIKKIYFFITNGRRRPISKAEILGRLVSCGFEILSYKESDNLLFFHTRKIREPYYDDNPSYGPILKIKKIGKGGSLLNIYKIRTMHPYSEYLQEYVYKENDLQQGGKFKNDFRISPSGKILRKFWLDELPMLINYLKGDIKLFGVRPLSRHYFSLYPEDFQKIRINYKPGLVPPYYCDLPKSFPEIIESEKRYLQKFDKHPFITDFKYFFKAVFNILFKKVRSK
ncbi:MAG: sugar transferase [Bacteroidales bacterium]|jgi:lipopolysaccharide/colanic/teichoic acid biosynthesis glycosyltransferase